MTKRHFIALAAVIKESKGTGSVYDAVAEQQRTRIAKRIADVCPRFNIEFDRTRFLAACDVEG